MRIYYDTEFLEDGRTIDLISIGMVAEDGREYYAVNSSAPWKRIRHHDWLMRNVVPHLPGSKVEEPIHGSTQWWWTLDRSDSRVKPRRVIANEVRDFIQATPDVELWAWYGAYDHVVLSWLWGPMIDHPEGVPMWTNDLRQEVARLGDPELPKQGGAEHDALADARWVRDAHLALTTQTT
jgi:hypothetical protein